MRYITVAIIIASTSHATAQVKSPTAKRSWATIVSDANTHLRNSRFAAARADYQAAYAMRAESLLLYNIGFCYQREEQPKLAISYFERYLEATNSKTDSVTLRQRQLAEKSVASLRSEILASERKARAKATSPVTVAPVREGDDRQSPELGRTWRWAGLSSGAVGGVLLAIAGLRLLRAQSISEEIADLPAGTPWTPELRARDAQAKSAESQGTILSIAGVGAMALGVTLYVVGAKRRRTGSSLTLVPHVGSERFGLVLVRSF